MKRLERNLHNWRQMQQTSAVMWPTSPYTLKLQVGLAYGKCCDLPKELKLCTPRNAYKARKHVRVDRKNWTHWAVLLERKEDAGPQTHGSKNHKSFGALVTPSVVYCFPSCGDWTTGAPQNDSKWSLRQFRYYTEAELFFKLFLFNFLSILLIIPRRKP